MGKLIYVGKMKDCCWKLLLSAIALLPLLWPVAYRVRYSCMLSNWHLSFPDCCVLRIYLFLHKYDGVVKLVKNIAVFSVEIHWVRANCKNFNSWSVQSQLAVWSSNLRCGVSCWPKISGGGFSEEMGVLRCERPFPVRASTAFAPFPHHRYIMCLQHSPHPHPDRTEDH